MPKPGPNTPTQALQNPLGAIPSPPGTADLSKAQLTADEVRMRLQARERDIQYHLQALKHEAALVFDDVNVDGRPVMDVIRERPAWALAVSAGAGAVVGLLWGLRRRARRRPVTDEQIAFVRARLDVALDRAARHVARGDDVETALERSMEDMPVLYGDASKLRTPRTSRQVASDAAVSAAAGFLAKAVADAAVRRFTGAEGTLDALADAAE